MIIQNQGHPVLVHDAKFVTASNGSGSCPEIAPAEVPEGHTKFGRGDVVALRDDEDPDGGVLIFTHAEMDSLVASWHSERFDHLRRQAAPATAV